MRRGEQHQSHSPIQRNLVSASIATVFGLLRSFVQSIIPTSSGPSQDCYNRIFDLQASDKPCRQTLVTVDHHKHNKHGLHEESEYISSRHYYSQAADGRAFRAASYSLQGCCLVRHEPLQKCRGRSGKSTSRRLPRCVR
jgi:hypothetical protein